MMQATAVALQEMQLWCSSKASLWMPLQLISQLFLCTAAHASLQILHAAGIQCGLTVDCQGLQLNAFGMQATWLRVSLVQLLCWLMPSLTSWQLLQTRLQMQVCS